MMAAMLETPSRIWRRIEAIEDRDMPSLPSLPSFDVSAEIEESTAQLAIDDEDDGFSDIDSLSSPVTSTPASHHTATLTGRMPSSTSSTARFANSIASRSNKSMTGLLSSRGLSSRRSLHDSFEIPSLPRIQTEATEQHDDDDDEQSKSSVPDVYLPPDDDQDEHPELDREYSLTDALESISRSSSPSFPGAPITQEATPKKNYDFSMSLKSEPKASPFDKYRNISTRRTNNPRTRTPSLSRTSSSQTSSPAHSTPQSSRSINLAQANSPASAAGVPLPRSRTNSPAFVGRRTLPAEDVSDGDEYHPDPNDTHDTRSMDITDVHISPPRFEGETHDHQDSAASRDESQPENSNDEREPTFSSEEGTAYGISNRAVRQTTAAFSSPSHSLAFTPTPAYPRPRTRFDIPSPPTDTPFTPAPRDSQQEDEEEAEQPHDDLMTPHTRRRSFLLSVINSTARPRMKLPTPHPRRFGTPGAVDATPGPTTYGGNPQADVTIGLTPRPRVAFARRSSHPLSQAITASSSNSSPHESNRSASVSASAHSRGQSPSGHAVQSAMSPMTPGQGHLSPYVGDRASFISTASSHDLTTHQRMNTSFDPAMGFGVGAPGHGVGRFNAGKLNNYLHGLNRRLQEENELLLERLRNVEEKKGADNTGATGNQTLEQENRRQSGGSRRSSAGTALGNVQEDVAEAWLEEKAELEEMVDAYKAEVETCMAEKEEMEKMLEMEKNERQRQEVQWREKMLDVEKGVQGLVEELQDKAMKAEEDKELAHEEAARRIKELERQILNTKGERDVAVDRASKAEKVLEGSDDIGNALNEANNRIGQVMGDLRNANSQMKELEEELLSADAKIEELEKQLAENEDIMNGLEEEATSASDALSAERVKTKQLEDTILQLEEDIKSNKAYAEELEEGAGGALDRVENLEAELAEARDTISRMTTSDHQAVQDIQMLEKETAKAQESAKELQEALEEAEQKMIEDEEEIASLKSKIASLERERQRDISSSTHSIPKNSIQDNGPTEAEYQALEDELDQANKELARLNALLNQSPARKAVDKAKEMRIEMLEREKEELLERNKALRMTFNEISTPHKVYNTSTISPIHRQVLNMSMKAPKTPGGPLRDMSWLHTTTAGDQSASPLVAEIQRLQRELDRANESIDDKLDKLEDAGMGVVGLTRKLEDARAKINALQDEIARLTRKEDRRSRRLARARCQKCYIKVDLRHLNSDESSMDLSRDNLPTEPPTPPTKTSDALRANLQSVNKHLEELQTQWETEKKKLVGEKAVLEDATNRLNTQVRSSKEEARKALESNRFTERNKAGAQSELERARQTIAVLENELGSERARLRSIVAEQEKMQREKKQILTDMQRTESDIDDVKQQLQKIKKENNQLERELRENANVDQKARILEARVVENADIIEQLRQERSLLATDHKDLQQKFAEVTESMNGLRKKYSAHSTTHENRKHELDMHRQEIDDLRRALDEKAHDLDRVEKEKVKIATEKSDVARTVAALEADLRRVKRDAESFGKDLKILRAEKEQIESKSSEDLAKAERAKKQAQAQLRLLAEQLEEERYRMAVVKDKAEAHVCTIRSDGKQITQIKMQHNKECKGLMVQIRYLKAKFVRESLFRNGLAYQKHYLLVLLGQFEKSERTIFASIARIGFPVAPPSIRNKPRKLKSVALMVIFLSRAKRARETWKEETAAKQAIADALHEVRKKRAAANI